MHGLCRSVRCLNISFHKSVFVRWSVDDWGTATDSTAQYLSSVDGCSDRFTASITIDPVVKTTLSLALCYQVCDIDEHNAHVRVVSQVQLHSRLLSASVIPVLCYDRLMVKRTGTTTTDSTTSSPFAPREVWSTTVRLRPHRHHHHPSLPSG